jgi:hypothetical protein
MASSVGFSLVREPLAKPRQKAGWVEWAGVGHQADIETGSPSECDQKRKVIDATPECRSLAPALDRRRRIEIAVWERGKNRLDEESICKKAGLCPDFFAIRDSGSARKLRPIELAIADPAPVGIAQPLLGRQRTPFLHRGATARGGQGWDTVIECSDRLGAEANCSRPTEIVPHELLPAEAHRVRAQVRRDPLTAPK